MVHSVYRKSGGVPDKYIPKTNTGATMDIVCLEALIALLKLCVWPSKQTCIKVSMIS